MQNWSMGWHCLRPVSAHRYDGSDLFGRIAACVAKPRGRHQESTTWAWSGGSTERHEEGGTPGGFDCCTAFDAASPLPPVGLPPDGNVSHHLPSPATWIAHRRRKRLYHRILHQSDCRIRLQNAEFLCFHHSPIPWPIHVSGVDK